MNFESIVAIVSGIVAVIAVFITAARYFSSTQKKISGLRKEIIAFQNQSELRKASMAIIPSENLNAPKSIYDKLLEISTEAERAVKAEIHSISVPVPSDNPVNLRIILSTDQESKKIIGREFPITSGIAGWVFQNCEPYRRINFKADPKYFSRVDKAAGTKLSNGSVLSLPIMIGQRCLGVIQFFQTGSYEFTDQDTIDAKRYLPALGKLLLELEENPYLDVPETAHGKIRNGSVLFTDIQSFSAVMDNVSLEVSAAMLNEYYNRMLGFSLSRGGKLQEYIGDGLYIYFGLDTPFNSAKAAIGAAIDMQKEYKSILESWQAFQHPVSQKNGHRVGIASGKIYLGSLGHPKDRREKLVGPIVNLASHLCEDIGSNDGITICSKTAELVSDLQISPFNTSWGKAFKVQFELSNPVNLQPLQ